MEPGENMIVALVVVVPLLRELLDLIVAVGFLVAVGTTVAVGFIIGLGWAGKLQTVSLRNVAVHSNNSRRMAIILQIQ